MLLAGDNTVPESEQSEWTRGTFVLAQCAATATHEGEFWGIPPTGNEFETGVSRSFRIDDGEIPIWRLMRANLILLDDIGVDTDALIDDLSRYVEE